MKKILFFLTLTISLQTFSQNFLRIEVKGKIIAESNDVSGIAIFNKSSNTGTVTNDNGMFDIKVKLNDVIEVSAIQFQNITFQVNEAIMESRSMKIFLIEEIRKLDEVIVSNNKLSGNLNTDVENTKAFSLKLDALYFGLRAADNNKFEPDYKSKVKNNLMNSQRQTMIYGLNIVNVVDQLLLPLFRSKVADKKTHGITEIPIEYIKQYFGSEFLTHHFNIPEHRVEEFIQFVQAEDFDYSLLNYGKEMQFLEFLHKKSITFLKI
ncbi:carboxypeptidase-like regulatory domain-containing protein [Snuella sedimenti]|uniref:Carboxypeptidase-like regulatory domain-containing protein n=1 Tax=Snuella sedimenti TaxID=2798802 RepID=A0A8J7J6X6_9FLAO|nr:carboxypeptidase-like regulatory domain-containing protein [Snuella sedimenti]MBJ6369644.1 carboxypeptidase-like regulatory domain-containing protein [Snuella sedimenti]